MGYNTTLTWFLAQYLEVLSHATSCQRLKAFNKSVVWSCVASHISMIAVIEAHKEKHTKKNLSKIG